MDGGLVMSVNASGSGEWCVRGAHLETPSMSCPSTVERRTLSVADVAARLEHRLYLSEATPRSVRDGCALAVRHGLSSVIVRPEHVREAGLQVIGTAVGVVTLPGWRKEDVEPLATKVLLAEARRLTAWGATDLGMLANLERLKDDDGRRFAGEVIALVEAMHACGARVRVVLDTDGMTPGATAAACDLLGVTGAWLVQGGSWRDTARTGLSRLQLMRDALPDEVALKWTFPVRSLDCMMICIAEGVDRFNGDPESVLKDAARRIARCPLVVPVRGVDY
jgi:deoxyribose-phosphate aldolase